MTEDTVTFVFGYGFDPSSPSATFTTRTFLRSEVTSSGVKVLPEVPESERNFTTAIKSLHILKGG